MQTLQRSVPPVPPEGLAAAAVAGTLKASQTKNMSFLFPSVFLLHQFDFSAFYLGGGVGGGSVWVLFWADYSLRLFQRVETD